MKLGFLLILAALLVPPARADEPLTLKFAWTAPLNTVSSQIALPVPLDIQASDPTSATHRIFPDARVHGSSAPFDIARQPDVNRDKTGH